jgi:DAK2 domain fusion protein YloV
LSGNDDQALPDRPALGARRCSGRELASALQVSARWLEAHADLVNSLNVYPVPDGDTGTNMHLTVRAALEELARTEGDSAGTLCQALAHGALMGARGNSGVILSQILRGIARALDKKDTFDAHDLAEAFREGAATAYKGVLRPVEGTMLTVIREAAEAGARASAQDGATLATVLQAITDEAERSLARTPSLLPVLKEAGVVDAGGQGLVLLLQGLLRYLHGEAPGEVVVAQQKAIIHTPGEEGYGYDIQFIVTGEGLDVNAMREVLSTKGDSLLVVGDERTVKVHIHAQTPGDILDYGCSLGIIQDVVVENMQLQHEAFVARRAQPAPAAEPPGKIGIVAVVPGPGLQRVFESLGVNVVVSGGQTMNPSTEELLAAVDSLPNEQVIILPNNSNVVLTAQQAKGLAKRDVAIVPTKTIPQGISALLALNYQADLATNTAAMEEAASAVQTIEITSAVRSARVNGLQVGEGQAIGLLGGELVAVGSECDQVALEVLERIQAGQKEIITIYYGADAEQSEAEAFAEKVKARYAGQDVELIDGGQPHYRYILSVE